MRIVSQDRAYDLPYEQVMLNVKRVYGVEIGLPAERYSITATFQDMKITLGEYKSKEVASFLMADVLDKYNMAANVVIFPMEEDVVLPE